MIGFWTYRKYKIDLSHLSVPFHLLLPFRVHISISSRRRKIDEVLVLFQNRENIFGSILVALVSIFVVYRIIADRKSVESGVQMTSTALPDNEVPDHAITGVTADAFDN